MTEPSEAPSGATAGALLRTAREQQGLHIAALAAAIKVPKDKLEALEADRYDDLPDLAFARALALTVCRALKIDTAPVLALLPHTGNTPLRRLGGGINEPFRERWARPQPREWLRLHRWAVWAAVLLLLGAAVIYFLPERLRGGSAEGPAGTVSSMLPTPVAATVATPAPAASVPVSPLVETVHAPPDSAVVAASPASHPAAPAGLLVLRVSAETWVEVRDGARQVLLSRTLQAGESVGVDGSVPLRLKIGNASAAQLSFRGQPVDLAPHTRDAVARLELK